MPGTQVVMSQGRGKLAYLRYVEAQQQRVVNWLPAIPSARWRRRSRTSRWRWT
ncbi:hypothetical protein [Micromonospora sp. NPDC047730]|uniref:hypothetical protein n=1 Tax=Micromonospora sp. NPDC047730 TaxID=3364253 RepID=UPI0037229EDB